MPNTHSTLTSLFSDIADSIRAKTGQNGTIVADEFPDAIDGIPTGVTPTGSVSITANGTYDVTEKASAIVNVADNKYCNTNGLYYTAPIFEIPSNVTSISITKAYANISTIEEVIIPSGITFSGANTFYNMLNLKKVTFNEGVTSSPIFMTSEKIEEINIPSTMTTLGANVFRESAQYVTNLDLKNISQLGSYCFFNGLRRCQTLTLRYNGVCVIDANTFNATSQCNFYVPSNLVDSYKSATNWANFADRIFAISE